MSLSDHLPVYCYRKRADSVKDFRYLEARSYRRFSNDVFSAAIEQFNWEPCFVNNDANWCWEFFCSNFIEILDAHAPIKLMRFDQNLPEWMTHECLSLMKRRDILDAKARKRPNECNRLLSRQVRNQVTNMKTNLKCMFFTNAIEDAKGDSRKLWKTLKKMLNLGNKSVTITEIEGSTDSIDMASKINDSFCNIGPNLAASIPQSILELNLEPDPLREPFHFKNVTVNDVKSLLMKMSNSKAMGEDGVAVWLMKLCPETIAEILSHIINLSLTNCIVPDGWKSAIVKPLF